VILRRCARSRRTFAVFVTIVAALVVTNAVAFAHSESGVLGIEATPGGGPLTVNVRVLLEYSGDRHVVPGATVVAAATGPNGTAVPDTPMTDRGEGRYEVTLTVPSPGPWTVTATAIDPSASTTASVQVTDRPSPTTTPTASPPDDRDGSSDRVDSVRDRDGGGDDGWIGAGAIGALAVVAVGAATVVLARRRR